MPRIQLITQDGSKMEFDLTIDQATFGRAEGNDIVIPDGSVSSRHGEILVKGDGIEIVDLGSTNGTHFNGQRVERAKVEPGESFKLGLVEGKLLGAPASAAVPARAPTPPPSAAPVAPPKPALPPPAPKPPPPPSGAKPVAPPSPGAQSAAAPPPSGPKLPLPPPPVVPEASAAEPAPPRESVSGGAVETWNTGPSAAVVMTGLGATPCPVKQRTGFGPKVKRKDKVAGILIAVGVVSLMACAAAAFMIRQMGG